MFLLGLVFMVGSTSAFSGWTVSSQVIKLVVTANGGVNVRLSPELSGCTSQSGYGPRYASVYPDHPGIQNIQANLLAAYMSKTPVTLFLVSDGTCRVGEMVLGGTHGGQPND